MKILNEPLNVSDESQIRSEANRRNKFALINIIKTNMLKGVLYYKLENATVSMGPAIRSWGQ